MPRIARLALVVAILAGGIAFPARWAFALIMGGEGNKPVANPGWPAGAAAVFDIPARVAYWEGPPFGGGQWQGEYRGDAKALNAALEDFAKVDVGSKRLVVHDGVGVSFWLNPNHAAEKAEAAKIDWTFMVWNPESWAHLRKLGPTFSPSGGDEEGDGPPSQIDVYTGGNIQWADVKVPPSIAIYDERLEAHGFTPADGTVLEGNVVDLANKPLAARIELQLIEPQPKGGYRYTTTTETKANANGHWVLTKVPTGWFRVVALADGFVPRLVGYAKFDGQPGWHFYTGELSPAATLSGRVADEAEKPLAEADVWLYDVSAKDKEYRSTDDFKTTTDTDGHFSFEAVPTGKARPVPHKTGYCRPGLGEIVETPAKDVSLVMKQSGQIHVVVDFAGAKPPSDYIVELTPEGGNVVGSWGGSSKINDKNEVTFNDAPPGRYELVGQPNPTTEIERTKPITVDLKGGATAEITIKANKPRKR